MIGELTGQGSTARCEVTCAGDGLAFISDAVPRLPEGEYRLQVNDLVFRVRFDGDRWHDLGEQS